MSTSGWNRPKEPIKEVRRSSKHGLWAGVVVSLFGCCVIAYFLASDRRKTGDDDEVRETPLLTEHPNATVVSGEHVIPDVSPDPVVAKAPDKPYQALNEVASNVVDISTTTNQPKKAKVVFKNPMDQLMSMVVPHEAGQAVPPVPIFSDEDFSPEQEKEMFEQMTADDDDSEETLERKELVQALRDEFADLKANRGWKFSDYIKALYAKANLDSEIFRESCDIYESVFHDPNISDKQYLETLEKINSVLQQRGIKPISAIDDTEDKD